MHTNITKNPYGDMAAERMNTLNSFLRSRFGRKMIKLALDGGFTCPNRDGSKGYGGCLFCGDATANDFASDAASGIASALDAQISLYAEKWPDAGYLAYFQNHTNTYAPVERLRELFEAALSDRRIEGLVIGTRPDCLGEDVLDLLGELNKRTFLWVELGLQTIHEKTAGIINRCYGLEIYDKAVSDLRERAIKTVTHLILGLPGETREDMFESLRYVCRSGAWGLKLHLLNVVKGSRMAKEMPDYVPFSSLEEYAGLVCDMIEEIPPEIVIHRLTGDASRKILISPPWSYKKRTILNTINKELARRGSSQGCAL